MMSLPLAVVFLAAIALLGAAIALAAFVWAVQKKQFSITNLNAGAYAVFDPEDRIGEPVDLLFAKTDKKKNPLDERPPS